MAKAPYSRLRVNSAAVLIVALLGLASLQQTAARSNLSLSMNLSPSMPLGLYWFRKAPRAIHRGDIVEACLPQSDAALGVARGYLPAGTCSAHASPVIKVVLAGIGDTVNFSMRGVTVNGIAVAGTRALPNDAKRRHLSHFPFGTYHLRRGAYWLWTPMPRTWDSRYYGPISISNIKGVGKLAIPFGLWPYASRLPHS